MSVTLPEKLDFRTSHALVGVTGAPGSGKSSFARACADAGLHVLDADQLAHEALHSEALREPLIKRFGPAIAGADGNISRPALAEIVFKDPERLQQLTQLIHPEVRERFAARVAQLQPGDVLIYDVPLLFEAHLEGDFDLTIAVVASPETRQRRLQARSGWSEEEFLRREAAQLPLTEKAKRADLVIENEGDMELLRALARDLASQLRARLARQSENHQ